MHTYLSVCLRDGKVSSHRPSDAYNTRLDVSYLYLDQIRRISSLASSSMTRPELLVAQLAQRGAHFNLAQLEVRVVYPS